MNRSGESGGTGIDDVDMCRMTETAGHVSSIDPFVLTAGAGVFESEAGVEFSEG